jgi:very-short-patch-repair endonuclease
MIICNKCKIEFVNSGSLSIHTKVCNLSEIDIIEIREKYTNGYSIRDITNLYKISKTFTMKIIKDIKRDLRDSIILAHKKYPERFKHSLETKSKLRESRLKWMKENPDRTAWRQSNLSYPEKVFLEKISELKWNNSYLIVREKSFFPYFVDFAFVNEKIAVEIDGSQHEISDRRLSDEKKDELLNSQGWKVIRFSASKILKDIDGCLNILLRYLKISDSEVGVYLHKDYKNKIKKEVDEFGFTKKQIESQFSQRRVERPSYINLLIDIKEFGYVGTGKKYNVSDNTIRKWKKMYEKYSK